MIRIGSRGSALALVQSRWVAARLAQTSGAASEIVVVKTSGDRIQDATLRSFGGVGVFTKEIDDGQRAGDFDVSVHSLKDLPVQGREGLLLAAVPARAPVEDCVVSRGGLALAALPLGAHVGTGSPRRLAQLLAARSDLRVSEIRGNVDTRIRKVREGHFDATLLARAGLVRLGFESEIAEILPFDVMLPAAGQGALAIVVREGCGAAMAAVARLDDPSARAEVEAERAVLSTLGGGCHLPLGCLARSGPDGSLTLRARVVSADGSRSIEESATGTARDAEALGRAVGERLLARGADRILREVASGGAGESS